ADAPVSAAQAQAAEARAFEAHTARERNPHAAPPAAEEIARARTELRQAQQDLERISQRIGELSRKAAAVEIERAFRAPAFGRPALGLVLSNDADAVRLAAVTPGSPAARAGLRGGDRLLGVDGQPIEGGDGAARLDHARALMGDLQEGQSVR